MKQTQQDMLRPNVTVAETLPITYSGFKNSLRVRRERDMTRTLLRSPIADHAFDFSPCCLQRHTKSTERHDRNTVTLANDTQQQMLGPDVVLVQ